MSTFSDTTVRLSNHFMKQAVTEEGGLLTGTDPAVFTTSDPLRLWIVQVGVIIVTSQLLFLGLRRLGQPKTVAEMLGGILLGPTALGRIPGFTEHIFPAVSIPFLSLVANIGLCLFLFLVGLQIDTGVVVRNARISVLVCLVSSALPFGLGAALSIPLYHHFIEPSIHFINFMLFTGIAYSITAFPTLCSILTEINMFHTNIGVVVLSAGIGNNFIAWTLLALSVALVNADSGLIALWILLVCIAFSVFLLFPVKFVLRWLAHRTGSTENGPTMFYMAVVLLLVWTCAFLTDSIGVSAIFGAFLAGLVVPREGGLAIALAEKLEDVVNTIFLPLYFALSGLNTNLALLNNGITWAFTLVIVVFSLGGKFGGCTIASRLAGYDWREASTIGALMSCKGLIELIVLNIGLQAGVFSQRVFSMFVLEALSLTFLTKPLVTAFYPPEHRARAGKMALPTKGDERAQIPDEKASTNDEEHPWRHRFTIVLDQLDHIPTAMALTQLVFPTPLNGPSDATSTSTQTDSMEKHKVPDVTVDALKLIDLSDRTSAMMKSSASDDLTRTDSVLGIFRMFGELHESVVTTSLLVVPHHDFARNVAEHAQTNASDLILLPWLPAAGSTAADTSDPAAGSMTPKTPKVEHNPFDVLFSVARSRSTSDFHSHFVRDVFAQSKTDVAVFVDTCDRFGPRLGGPMHVFLPFFGGPDDRLALSFVVQLCLNPRMMATVIRVVKRDGVDVNERLERPSMAHLEDKTDAGGLRALTPITTCGPTVTSTIASPITMHGQPTTETYLQSETADNIAWSKYTSQPCLTANGSTHVDSSTLRNALSRIHFSEAHTPAPLHAAIQRARALREASPRLLVIAGRSRRLAKESHHVEMKRLLEVYRPGLKHEGMRRTIGDVGTAMIVSGSASAVVVLQVANVALG